MLSSFTFRRHSVRTSEPADERHDAGLGADVPSTQDHAGNGASAANSGGGASRNAALVVGTVEAVLAGLLYTVGWSRAYSYDASRTVGQFVAVDSMEPILRQDRFNNHPLFSLVDHLVYAATGSDDERILRVAPIIFAALSVGLIAASVARRFGSAAGAVAGATSAVNVLTVCHLREVRGYSLVTLTAVIATLAMFKRMRSPSLGVTVAYVAAMAVAIGTHLFVLALLVLHVVVIMSSARRRILGWFGPWAVAVAVGLSVQLPAIIDGLGTPPVHRFNPWFPLVFSTNLLGGGPAVPGMLLLVIAGWAVLRSRPWVPWTIGSMAVMAGAAWVAGPSWLSPRFFVWLVPATAVAAGVGVGHRPRLVYVAAGSVVVQLVALGPGLTSSEVPNRIAAGFVRAAQREGGSVCALGRSGASLRAYAGEVPVVWDQHDLAGCDLAVEASPGPQPLLESACRRFPYVLALPATHPGAVFAHHPRPLAPEFLAEAPSGGSTWERSAGAAACHGRTGSLSDRVHDVWRGWWCS